MTGRLNMSYASHFAEALEQKFSEDTFRVDCGRKFDKIVQTYKGGNIGSVHAFVEKNTGMLIKAATWKAPQKSVKHPTGLAVRYDISTADGFNHALMQADRFGGYLYEH